MQTNTNYLAFQSLYFDFISSLLLTTIKYAKSYSKFRPFFLNDCYFPISHIGIIKNLSNYVLINYFFLLYLINTQWQSSLRETFSHLGFHIIRNECVINWLQFSSETKRYYNHSQKVCIMTVCMFKHKWVLCSIIL